MLANIVLESGLIYTARDTYRGRGGGGGGRGERGRGKRGRERGPRNNVWREREREKPTK